MQITPGRYETKAFADILSRKARIEQSKWALPWAFLNFVLALIVYMDIEQGSVTRYFASEFAVLWYLECSVGAVLIVNCIIDLLSYAWYHLYESPIEIDEKQKKLFGIEDSDIGFKQKPASAAQTSTPKTAPRSNVWESFVLPSAISTPVATPPLASRTCFDTSAASWASSSFGSSPNMSITSSSWLYQNGSPYERVSHSGYSPSLPEQGSGGSGLRRRCPLGGSHSSSSLEWNITDEKSLEQYMNECSRLEQTSQLMASGESPRRSPGSHLRWGAGQETPPFSGGPRGQYQLSTRSPQAAPQSHVDEALTTFSGDGVWHKWGIHEKQLNQWVENLRKWVSQTILSKLSSEIDAINSTLKRLGSSDLQIGEASQSTLRQVSLTKSQHLPTLGALLPYLDLTSNQEYLVQRIKELAQGGCMSDFHWSTGSSYKGKPWGDYLPTDSALVLHMLCTYLDSRLPPDPRFPDGKTFTSQFFGKTPDKPPVSKDGLCIYQSCICPPHYCVIIGEQIWDLPKGRNNLFFAILLFLHYIKTKKSGMLGRVNLGPSGVNILCVVD